MPSRKTGLGVVLTFALACAGCRDHLQREGDYAFTATEVIEDDCNLLAGGTTLWDGSLQLSGDVVRMEYALFNMDLSGNYLSKVERFYVDGTVANVTALARGQECLLDQVVLHMDATTDSATQFEGTMGVTYDTESHDQCYCQLVAKYQAVHK